MSIYRQFNGSSVMYLPLAAAAVVGFTPILPVAIGYPILTLLSLFVFIPNLSKLAKYPKSLLLTCVCLYVAWGLLYGLLNISDGFGTIIMQMQFLFCIVLMLFILTTLSPRRRLWILGVMLIVVCANILDNIRLCNLYPEIAGEVNRSMEMEELIGKAINIGGSMWYNGVTFFLIVCFFAFLNAERKLYRYIMLACCLLTSLFIFGYCLKASVIIFAIMAVILLYLAKRFGKNTTYLMVIAFVFFIIYLVVDLYSDEIISFIVSNINNKRLAFRLIALVDINNEEAEVGVRTVEGRAHLWILSLKTWLDSPLTFLLGIGDHSPSYRFDGMGIGYHSDFFDTPARFGLIGLILMYKILRLSFKHILFFFDKIFHLQLYVIFGMFILFGFTKGVFNPSVGCPFFLLLPLSSVYLSKSMK